MDCGVELTPPGCAYQQPTCGNLRLDPGEQARVVFDGFVCNCWLCLAAISLRFAARLTAAMRSATQARGASRASARFYTLWTAKRRLAASSCRRRRRLS